MTDFPLYLIPLLPFIGAGISLVIGRRLGKNAVTLITLGSVFASFLVTLRAVWTLHESVPATGALVSTFFGPTWIKAGDLNIAAGLTMDHLSALLCCVVTGIGFLIHVYSTAYMEHDDRYTRFFAFLNLFTGSMLILVLGDSLPVTFVGWEGVGLCSYLLIGFWFDKDANALAGRKAFVVNRIGDFGFLLAIFLLYSKTGTLKYSELANHIDPLKEHIWWGMSGAYFVGLLVLLGATGKSAQIPLYIWLPDAMAGPTPVSALIHAATMVTAGVYMVARLHIVFETAPVTLAVVACIGAATALFAATMGIAQRDLKKVLAYSTIPQLGFMFVGVGTWNAETHTGNYQAGIFHLVTHAFFKAGLFLGAGSVMHALNNEGDIMKMGGLKKWLPHTRWTFLIYCLAIAGIIPFAGFWSKDAILGGLWDAQWMTSGPPTNAIEHALFVAGEEGTFFLPLGHYLYWVMLLAAGCTAFYMFRLYFLVFEGEYRGPLPDAHGHDDHAHDDHGHGNVQSNAAHAHGQGAHGHDAHDTHGHDAHGHGGLPHESPPAMTIVLWILALGSIVVGLFGIPDVVSGRESDLFGDWLRPVLQPLGVAETAGGFWKGAVGALAVAGGGIGLAFALYFHGVSAAVRKFVATLPGLYKLVFHKYYIDEIYDFLVVRPLRLIAFVLWKGFDAFFIDLIFVNGIGFVVGGFGKLVKYLQNGDLQRYIVALILGAAAMIYYAANGDARRAAQFDVVVVGNSVEVNARGAGPSARRLVYSVEWDAASGCSADNYGAAQQTTTFRHTYDTPGKHEISVKVQDPKWGSRSVQTRTVKVQ